MRPWPDHGQGAAVPASKVAGSTIKDARQEELPDERSVPSGSEIVPLFELLRLPHRGSGPFEAAARRG